MASDKALALQLCRKEFPQRWKTMNQIFIKRKKGTVCVQTLEDSERATPSWWFEPLLWGLSSKFPLADHFALPASELAFGLSQDLRVCAHISHQVGFQWRRLWVDSPLDLLSDLSSRKYLLDLRIWEICGLLFGQDPAYSLDCPAIDIDVLEFLSTRNEPRLLFLWRRKGIYLLPQFYQERTSEKTMVIYNLIESQRQAEWKK